MATVATTIGNHSLTTSRVGIRRALSVAGAVIAALAVWVIAVPMLGAHLTIRFGSGAPQTIGIALIAGASLLGSLGGWGLLALLERRTARARTIWTGVAVIVVLASLSLPLTAATTTSAKVALGLTHVAVAAMLIPALRLTSSARRA
jgi:Family of unknown function (DUF6069)